MSANTDPLAPALAAGEAPALQGAPQGGVPSPRPTATSDAPDPDTLQPIQSSILVQPTSSSSTVPSHQQAPLAQVSPGLTASVELQSAAPALSQVVPQVDGGIECLPGSSPSVAPQVPDFVPPVVVQASASASTPSGAEESRLSGVLQVGAARPRAGPTNHKLHNFPQEHRTMPSPVGPSTLIHARVEPGADSTDS